MPSRCQNHRRGVDHPRNRCAASSWHKNMAPNGTGKVQLKQQHIAKRPAKSQQSITGHMSALKHNTVRGYIPDGTMNCLKQKPGKCMQMAWRKPGNQGFCCQQRRSIHSPAQHPPVEEGSDWQGQLGPGWDYRSAWPKLQAVKPDKPQGASQRVYASTSDGAPTHKSGIESGRSQARSDQFTTPCYPVFTSSPFEMTEPEHSSRDTSSVVTPATSGCNTGQLPMQGRLAHTQSRL